MGSRVLTTLSAHEGQYGWPRTLLAKVKQQRRALAAFLKWGWAAFFGNEGRKGDPFDAHPGPSFAWPHAVVVIRMAAKDFVGLCLMRDLGVTADEPS
jgi:hypothetical protein